ncbi:dihydrolipoamide acetyltransferase family protein [Bacillus sp. B15-48]|uniref:dihydrolipoamide acetyltransferase family protein n=1 Tax=Bacillus sp. B15-48 TaxID=1548601 RepID=UPI00193EFF78|nr:dihydrolipoamide acetyltransferase family protein [Bacillus sp. B15-48]MBM4762224.1 2-oxo acid dehydrogenase subunit E2 [Bacillus sp. B15-48]
MTVEHIKMPQLGESVTEGTVSKWLVSPGDTVNKYDPLAEITSDKVNAEIPSSFSGTVKELVASEGDTISVGETILVIETESSLEGITEVKPEKETNETASSEKKKGLLKSDSNENHKKMRYSPAVLKLSQEHGIDLASITGSGAGGRITRKDLLRVIESKATLDKDITQAKVPVRIEDKLVQPSPIPSPSMRKGDIEIAVTGIRKTIATNMVRSKQEIPHAWTMIEVDVTNLVSYRNELKDDFKRTEGFNLTYFAFFVKAAAQALKEFPQVNSIWAGDKIIQKKEVNLSIAVATEEALYVPVIKNADEKSVKGIAREIAELAEKVRSGKLCTEDMQGGTFTVNNTGSFGSVQSMGIINYPQAAILQVESIVKRPMIMNNSMIAVREMVNLCLSLDHRILDGLVCGRFLKRVKEILENTSKETTPIY